MRNSSPTCEGRRRAIALAGRRDLCLRLQGQLVAGDRATCILEFSSLTPIAPADCAILAIASVDLAAQMELVRNFHDRNLSTPLIVALEGYSDLAACTAFRAGASDVRSIEDVLSSPLLQARPVEQNAHVPEDKYHPEMSIWVGSSSSARHLRTWLPKVAETDCSVLVTGETGCGKELIAELIHKTSKRHKARMVSINCAAVPETLIESELFGHEKGAFTGAIAQRQGAFEAANGGTLFLDEIGDMPPLAQAKILRALETKQVQRIGSESVRQLNLRVVAATNQPLAWLVSQGGFRKDLMYRLKVVEVHLPPLRERPEDIVELLDHFLLIFRRKYGGRIQGFSAEAMGSLLAYDWPGNVRELRNLVEYLFIEPGRVRIEAKDLPLPSAKQILCTDREQLMETLAKVQWNKSAAARLMKWSRMTLYRKMAKYDIPDEVRTARSM